MNFGFLPFRKNNIPDRNDELKPILKDTFARLKRGEVSKKEQAALAALLLAATCGIGYGAFIHAPLAEQEALKAAMKTSVAHAQEANEEQVQNTKPLLKETDVEKALADDIASDPNVAIANEEVVSGGGSEGNLNVVIEHNGPAETLTQYLETLESLPYRVVMDSVSYIKDPSNMESTTIRLSIPYEIVDNSLEAKDIESPAPSAPSTPAQTPETTATPTTGSSSGSSSTSSTTSGSWTPSRSTGSSYSYSKTPSTTVRPSTSTSSSSSTSKSSGTSSTQKHEAKKPANPAKKDQVKPQSEKPPMTSETTYLAPPITRYSVIDTFLRATGDGTFEVSLETDSTEEMPKEKRIGNLVFTTPTLGEEGQAVQREIFLDTGGFYLPKNGYEFSIDIVPDPNVGGEYSLLLSDLEGRTKEVLPVRKTDVGDGFTRLFFPLNGMDGTVRAVQMRYKFQDPGEASVSIPMKNVQILSHEK